MLHFLKKSWDLRFEDCPCDAHFVEWLEHNRITGKTIFHFGTGGHHYVGRRCAEPHLQNAVLGVTATPREYDSFIKLAIREPAVARLYSVAFSDIYNSNAKLIPDLDAATMFHLCEFRDEKNDAYGALTDLEMLRLFAGRVNPGGHILFYTGSYAREKAAEVIEAWRSDAPYDEIAGFKTLRVFAKRTG